MAYRHGNSELRHAAHCDGSPALISWHGLPTMPLGCWQA
jgi:hypothetical protein